MRNRSQNGFYTDNGLKGCASCRVAKPETAYARDRSKADGLRSSCRICESMKRAQIIRTNPGALEARREQSRRFRRENPEKFRRSVRNATIKAKYGIDLDRYEEILSKQGGVCAICGSESPKVSWTKNLHIDHDHESGKVRGLLCQGCNTSIGKLNDSPALLRKAADYIEQGGFG